MKACLSLANKRHIKDIYNCLISSRPLSNDEISGGMTFVAKDNIATTKEPTTCGSKLLEHYHSPFQATAISLLEAEQMTLVGKANMDEFGMGSSTIYSHYGATLNPIFSDARSAGGSSGGSAAAVAGGLADFALGTDTGGSVRQPASYCGIAGFKPSYGRISRYGVVAYGQALDCVGILSPGIRSIRRIYDILNRYDDKDITSMSSEIRRNVSQETQKRSTAQPLRIGVPQEFLLAELPTKTRDAIEYVLRTLMAHGHTVVPVSIPSIEKSVSAYYTLVSAEAASNLSRFDGKAFGCFSSDQKPLVTEAQLSSGVSLIHNNRAAGLGTEVKRRILLGNYTLSTASGDTFLKATHLRRKLVEELNDIFAFPNFLNSIKNTHENGDSQCDVLLGPTCFGEAPTIEECVQRNERGSVDEYLNDVFTVPANLAGLPAISVPSQTRSIGIQVIGQYGDDEMVLYASQIIEDLLAAQ